MGNNKEGIIVRLPGLGKLGIRPHRDEERLWEKIAEMQPSMSRSGLDQIGLNILPTENITGRDISQTDCLLFAKLPCNRADLCATALFRTVFARPFSLRSDL
jgi:hypothetical protein